MVIERPAFTRTKLDEEKAQEKDVVIPTKWNEEDIKMLMDGALRIRQAKKSTVIKMLAKIGYAKVVQEQKTIENVLDSYRRNKRLGIPEIEAEIKRNFSKSNTKIE